MTVTKLRKKAGQQKRPGDGRMQWGTIVGTPNLPQRDEGGFLQGVALGLPWQPVVKTMSFHTRGTGLMPGHGTKIPHVTWCGQKIKKEWHLSQDFRKRRN